MKDVSFQLDQSGGAEILQNMVMPTIQQSADAISARAGSMASSQSSDPPTFEVSSRVGVIRRGERAIATIKANSQNPHQDFIAHDVLVKAKDAGRVK
jgi:hypothetical protein